MNEQKAYKTLMVVVAVAALGFGGRWLFGRDSGGNGGTVPGIRTGTRKPRETVQVTPPKNLRKPRPGRKVDLREPKRNVRETRGTSLNSRRRPRHRRDRTVTKVTMPPMG